MSNYSISYQGGVEAAKRGCNINNSHPFNHREFVNGYNSVKPEAEIDNRLAEISLTYAYDEYKNII